MTKRVRLLVVAAALTSALTSCASSTSRALSLSPQTTPSPTAFRGPGSGSTASGGADSESSQPTNTFVALLPPALKLLLDSTTKQPDTRVETIEVWICEVPLTTTAPVYNASTLRLPLTPSGVTDTLNRYVSTYFDTLSHGLYRPRFVAGSAYTMADADTPGTCVDDALSHAVSTSNAVFAVATAEHTAAAPGGFGMQGTPCSAPAPSACTALSTGRAAYVGASDFHPDWGPEPAVDLAEHEIGHLLGWPHSGDDHGEGHTSGLDLMSDSAAPRDFDPARRDGPDTLAVNRLAAGWLGGDGTVIGSDSPIPLNYSLVASFAATGPRVLILPIDDTRMLTVEFLAKSGFDSFLPHAGVTITLVDQSPQACGHTSGEPCTGGDRLQLTKVGSAPFYDMLKAPGDTVTVDQWKITLMRIDTSVTVQVARVTTSG